MGGGESRCTVPVRRGGHEDQQKVAELDRCDALEVIDVAERLYWTLRDGNVEQLLKEGRRQQMVLRDAESD